MTEKARSTADILLELLKKVPEAATLELLLQPRHLLSLLRAQGWSDEEIRRDLTAGGRTPGELLLAVLARQPDSTVLLTQLGNPAPAVAPRRRAASPGNSLHSPGQAKPIAAILFGLLLAAPSGWFLFVKLDVLHVPGLVAHFPGAYTLMFSALVGGLLLSGRGVRDLLRG